MNGCVWRYRVVTGISSILIPMWSLFREVFFCLPLCFPFCSRFFPPFCIPYWFVCGACVEMSSPYWFVCGAWSEMFPLSSTLSLILSSAVFPNLSPILICLWSVLRDRFFVYHFVSHRGGHFVWRPFRDVSFVSHFISHFVPHGVSHFVRQVAFMFCGTCFEKSFCLPLCLLFWQMDR